MLLLAHFILTDFSFGFLLIATVGPPIFFDYKNKPERTIYIFLILWITFPKFIRTLPIIGTIYLEGLGYFDFLHCIVSFHISFQLLKQKYLDERKIKIPKILNLLTTLNFWTFFLAQLSGLTLYLYLKDDFSRTMASGLILEYFGYPIYSLIFFFGLLRFIIDKEKIDSIITIIAFSGLLILLEHFLFLYLGLFKNLSLWTFAKDGNRYASIFYQSYDLKGIFCVISSISFLYIGFNKR